jgi:hypothetical protein
MIALIKAVEYEIGENKWGTERADQEIKVLLSPLN